MRRGSAPTLSIKRPPTPPAAAGGGQRLGARRVGIEHQVLGPEDAVRERLVVAEAQLLIGQHAVRLGAALEDVADGGLLGGVSPVMRIGMERLGERVERVAESVGARVLLDPEQLVVRDGVERGEPLPDRVTVHRGAQCGPRVCSPTTGC